uniref:Uncharacterized protein n=1 Tax=Rhizophora mucronata TaxID=61149 RepID=A0A2P2JBJ4_RHIMU
MKNVQSFQPCTTLTSIFLHYHQIFLFCFFLSKERKRNTLPCPQSFNLESQIIQQISQICRAYRELKKYTGHCHARSLLNQHI